MDGPRVITDDDRLALREAAITVLAETRLALRSSELSIVLSHDPRFMLWATCLHVGIQMAQASRYPDRRVRAVHLPIGGKRYFGWRQVQPMVKAWVIADMTARELVVLRQQTRETGEPIPCDDVEDMVCR